jgi:hypothetical protein
MLPGDIIQSGCPAAVDFLQFLPGSPPQLLLPCHVLLLALFRSLLCHCQLLLQLATPSLPTAGLCSGCAASAAGIIMQLPDFTMQLPQLNNLMCEVRDVRIYLILQGLGIKQFLTYSYSFYASRNILLVH